MKKLLKVGFALATEREDVEEIYPIPKP